MTDSYMTKLPSGKEIQKLTFHLPYFLSRRERFKVSCHPKADVVFWLVAPTGQIVYSGTDLDWMKAARDEANKIWESNPKWFTEN